MVAEAAATEGAALCRSRSDLAEQAEVEGRADSDLSLDPNDAEALAWSARLDRLLRNTAPSAVVASAATLASAIGDLEKKTE